MKMPFVFGGKSGKKNRSRKYQDGWDSVSDMDDMDFEDDFTGDEEYIEDSDEAYVDDEFAGDEYAEEEYAEEYAEAEVEEEYIEEYTEAEAEEEYAEEYTEAETEEEYVEEYAELDYEEEYVEEYAEAEYSHEEKTGRFAAGAFLSEEFDEIRYEEEAYDGDEYGQDDDYEEYDYADEYDEEDEKEGFLALLARTGVADKLIMLGGLAVLLVALIVGSIFVRNQMFAEEENELIDVGRQLTQIETIGGSGLLAVSDAQKAALEAEEIVEEEEEKPSTEYEEEEYKTEVNVKLSMASIEKDLKIKFINKETGKLVGNVPFSIQVTEPDGGQSLWSDDDMDGIIYKKNLEAGQYKITVNPFRNDKYKKYGIPSGQQKVEVKAKIDYNKVDVSDEVKSESQVDVQKEDTKKNETVVESYLNDTVPWVESTATLVSYTEVAKSNIIDPLQPPTDSGSTVDTSFTTSAVQVSAVSSPGPVTPDTTVSGGDIEAVPTPTPSPMVMTLDKKAVTIYVDHPVTITVSVENLMKEAKITAESSDTNVATVAINDKAITITGILPGTANITVNCTAEVIVTEKTPDGTGTVEKNQIFKAEPMVCAVVVKANPQMDTTTILKDNQGREVYVLDGQNYRPAFYADYYTYSKFFVKGEAKYTGWQILEGKRFFFDASGKAVTGEQVIQGVKYNFASDGSLVTGSGTMGIDVSKWNGNIDWTAVKNSGVSYVIIRCGYRGSSQGALIKDSKFESNIQGAINAGLKVGVYFFTQAIDKNEALEEASMVLDCVKKYKISYPIFLDVEPSGGRADDLDVITRTEICKTFCETIQNYGYTAGVYANTTWLTEKIKTSELSSSYKIWLAQYASEPTYTGRYDMWQYKSTGKIDGISGDVDMNLSYLGY